MLWKELALLHQTELIQWKLPILLFLERAIYNITVTHNSKRARSSTTLIKFVQSSSIREVLSARTDIAKIPYIAQLKIALIYVS